MWNLFRGRRKKARARRRREPEPPANRVDEVANLLLLEDRAADLEVELTKLDYSALSAQEQESWWHSYGIAAFQTGRDPEALTRFQEAHEKFPNSPNIRFSLGQQYIRAKSIDEGFALFRTCLFPEIPADFALAQAQYAYLWNRYSDGQLFIRPFFQAYKELKILDDTFLDMRGLPFFPVWWGNLAAFGILAKDLTELESATEFVLRHCLHDYDPKRLRTEFAVYRDDKPELLLPLLEKILRENQRRRYPTGEIRMKIAIIQAQNCTSLDIAERLLTDDTISRQEFSLLDDVRTLALAEAAFRFDRTDREEAHVKAFLERQALLFEPDIALNFQLLKYQERLKPRIWAR
jgi:hypothetical protein